MLPLMLALCVSAHLIGAGARKSKNAKKALRPILTLASSNQWLYTRRAINTQSWLRDSLPALNKKSPLKLHNQVVWALSNWTFPKR